MDDPLYPVTAQFPLGRPFGLLPVPEGCATEELPFGLRNAVPVQADPTGDPSSYGYDREQQIGVGWEAEVGVPLLKHTSGQTRTFTNPDGQRGPDSDADWRED